MNELQKSDNPTPAMLLQQAIMNKLDINHLERLMKLQEDWEKRQAEKAFKLAFANFQAQKPELKKLDVANFQTKNGQVKYHYNAISNIQKAVDPILGKNGLSYRWEQEQKGEKIKITCIVSHIDGHSESTWIEALSDNTGSKNSIQAIGSTITYLKRYTLEGALGLASGNDDDGKGNSENKDDVEILTKALKELDKVKNKSDLQKIWNKYKQFRNHETFKIKVTNLNKKFMKNEKSNNNEPELL